MKQWRIGSVLGGTTIAVLLATATQANAFSFLGFNIGDSPPGRSIQQASPSTNADTTDGNTQANTFIDDIVSNANNNTCLQFSNHEYEVCTAYIFNSAMADLVPYYSYANSADTWQTRFVSHRLDSRYVGEANQLIRTRVSWWPTNITNHVDVPAIRILSVNANLANNTATLQTIETWRVSNSADNVIYEETNVPHTVTMERVPSYLLHKWVVTNMD